MPPAHIVICAGETSGDLLAAGLVRELCASRPEIRFSGTGGEGMRAHGVETLIDVSELSVMGLWEVLRNYRRLTGLLRRMQEHVRRTRPDLLVLVDFVEFNLRLAEYARTLGIRTLFYVSPQIWAWKERRIHRIKRAVDAMAVLFPFEEGIYREHGIPVRYVGNPLVDRVRRPVPSLRTELGLAADQRIVGLLPGSRSGELRRHWPVLVETARCLHATAPDLDFAVPLAPGFTGEMLQALAPSNGLPLTFLEGPDRALQVMAAANLLLISSGTATLEAALLRTPMIVIYRMSPLGFAIASRLVRVPHIALANIVAGREVVPERLQRAANSRTLCSEARELLDHPERLERMRGELDAVHARLGEGGADARVAATVLELLETGTLA